MHTNRFLMRYPVLFFVLAAIIISNNLFEYAPAQVLTGIMAWLIPAILVILGIYGISLKNKSGKKNSASGNTTFTKKDKS